MKTQFIRLLDVFVFGPVMIYAGREHPNKFLGTSLVLIGLGTIVYNGVNYLTAEQQKRGEHA